MVVVAVSATVVVAATEVVVPADTVVHVAGSASWLSLL
jgi:hypothetical protein